MIKCKRVNTCENITFDSVEFLSIEEQKALSLPDLFEIDQLCFRDSFGDIHLVNDEMVGMISIRHMTPSEDMLKVKRIVATWDQISYSPCWLILEDQYEKYNIPHVYANLEDQFTFIADNTLYITKDDRIALVSFY